MSRFSGPQGKGAVARHKESVRLAIEAQRSRRCPSGKRPYPTERDARVELVGAGVDRNRGRCHRKECRVYECPLCGWFHLTSKPERKAS